jgi:hypothetical protein
MSNDITNCDICGSETGDYTPDVNIDGFLQEDAIEGVCEVCHDDIIKSIYATIHDKNPSLNV